MLAKVYAHLPGVKIDSSKRRPLGGGRLVQLPYETFRRLDNAFPFADSDYEKSSPTFFSWETNLPDNEDEMDERVFQRMTRVHRCLLLVHDTPLLPPPRMSVMYISFRPRDIPGVLGAVRRLIGPFERDWVIYGGNLSPTLFDEPRLSEARTAYDLLEHLRPGNVFLGIASGLEILALTAHPEFSYSSERDEIMGERILLNGFIHCVAAVENIVLQSPEGASTQPSLTTSFGRHVSVLLSSSPDELDKSAGVISDMYRLRSRLIHGEIGVANLGEGESKQLTKGRLLLRDVLVRALALQPPVSESHLLPRLLSDAYENRQTFRDLAQRLGRHSKN